MLQLTTTEKINTESLILQDSLYWEDDLMQGQDLIASIGDIEFVYNTRCTRDSKITYYCDSPDEVCYSNEYAEVVITEIYDEEGEPMFLSQEEKLQIETAIEKELLSL